MSIVSHFTSRARPLSTLLGAGGLLLAVAAPAQAGLVGHYTFDDSTANDSSGSGAHGSFVGTAAAVSDPIRGQVLELDGVTGNYVSIASPVLDASDTGNATVAAWVLMDVSKNHNAIFSQGEWRDGTSLSIKGDTDPDDQIWTGKDQPSSAGIPDDVMRTAVGIPVGEWVHVAGTWNYNAGSDETTVTLYLNGVPLPLAEGDGTLAGMPIAPVEGISRIGMEDRNGDGSGARWTWDGRIDDVRVYDEALSPLQVAALVTPIPEPSSLALLGLGGLAALRRRRSA